MSETKRAVKAAYEGIRLSEGAGVNVLRTIGSPDLNMLDPFLLLDEFRSDDPDDYIAGFPSHPHRGFETVTYMLAGAMRHEDSSGASGELAAGGVQWMTAGRGVIHSEMPQIKDGLMWGFQLWVNLPASRKMTEPRYQNIDPADVPAVERPGGVRVKVIAGNVDGVAGPVSGVSVDPLFLDIELSGGAEFGHGVPVGHTCFAFVYDGSLTVDGASYAKGSLVVFGDGEHVALSGGENGGGVLLLAARPLYEPVARGGPFVMNTREELTQAFSDYNSGVFGR